MIKIVGDAGDSVFGRMYYSQRTFHADGIATVCNVLLPQTAIGFGWLWFLNAPKPEGSRNRWLCVWEDQPCL